MSRPVTAPCPLPLIQVFKVAHPDQAAALAELLAAWPGEDASLLRVRDAEKGIYHLSGSTPRDLTERTARLRSRATTAGLVLDIAPLTVGTCWAPARSAEGEQKLGRAGSTSGAFAVVRLRITPRATGEGNSFESEFAGPPEIDVLNEAVARGVARAWAEGHDGAPLVDMRVIFTDGAFHPARSTPAAFEQAALAAMRTACTAAGLRRLEPVAEIEISAERDQVLPIVGDLAQRGGHELRRRLAPKGRVIIQAELPMRSFLSYDRDLGTLSGGRARLLGEPRLIRWAEVRQR